MFFSALLQDISPSAVKWDDLVDKSLAPRFRFMLDELQKADKPVPDDELPTCCKGFCRCKKNLVKYVSADTEGYAVVLAVPVLAHILEELNHGYEDPRYKCHVTPVVKQYDDQRKNKKTDYFICRVQNERIRLVIELKSTIGAAITGGSKKFLAQLVLEVYYAIEKNFSNDDVIGVLSDCSCWHFFHLDCKRSPLAVTRYVSLVQPDIEQLCRYLRYFIHVVAKRD